MIVKKLYLENYRNYDSEVLDFDNGTNVLYGFNGQGKTNIIEAIYYFCTCKSFRSIHDDDVIKFNKDYAHIKIDFEASNRDNNADIYITEKKSIKVNGINLERQSELIGLANMVIFTPEHLNLIKEGPSVRRNFLDVFISQIKPLYFVNLINYYKVLKQRNNILKSKNKKMLDTMDVWNEKIAQYGTQVSKYRSEALQILDNYVNNFELENEKIKIEFLPSVKDDFTSKETFIKHLEYGLERDMEKGITMTGPHRDDFDVLLNEKSLKKYGSQGQTRTAVLKMKLAECEIINNINSEQPLLLLDDVLSELDENRRKFFTSNIKNRQIIITCTDKELISKKDVKFFYINDGKVKQE